MTDQSQARACTAGCTLGFLNFEGRWSPCPRCGATGLEEVAEVRAEFHAGYLAGLWLDTAREGADVPADSSGPPSPRTSTSYGTNRSGGDDFSDRSNTMTPDDIEGAT